MPEMGVDVLAILLRKIEDVERRMRRMIVFGTVTDVDHANGLVRVTDGMVDDDGKEMKTDWLPWAEHAGKIKTRTMPSVGQQVTLFSPSGTMEQGLVTIGWYNENNKMPKAPNGEHVFINGTHYKQVIGNGPGVTVAGGDGSDSTAGQQAKKARADTRNKTAKGVIETRIGKLSDDEGSWGDGRKQIRPQGDDKTLTERSEDEKSHVHHAEKPGKRSTRTQVAAQVETKVNTSSRKQTATRVVDTVGGSKFDIAPDAIDTTADNLGHSGKTFLGELRGGSKIDRTATNLPASRTYSS